ncbi:DNA cytosine methyltransferase [Streptomyces sp. CA-250714]|uniref:DNA cytosine methyltransferase n=1 Tax=Streptomyces sp. CA-250714 TaxID=3240060 RepID=UPI003D8FE085
MSAPLRIGSVCTGYGGLDMAVQSVLGGELAWVADNDPGAARILSHHWPDVPNLGDVTTCDFGQVEPVDIFCGGYPCQPFSLAGELKGTADDRHIWPDIARALRVLRPRLAIFENVAHHLRLGFDTVLSDLADLGFDAEWRVVRADHIGAPHQRRRLVFIAAPADTPHLGHQRQRAARQRRHGPAHSGLAATDATGDRWHERRSEPARLERRPGFASGGGQAWGPYAAAIARWEAATGRRAPGPTDARGRLNPPFVEWLMGLPAGWVTDVPGLSRTAQLTALGNGVVPQQASAALGHLLDRQARERTAGAVAA